MAPGHRVVDRRRRLSEPGVPVLCQGDRLRWSSLLWMSATLVGSAACGPSTATATATAPAADGAPALRHRVDLARGPLTYAVDFVDERQLVSIELGERFELVVRDVAVAHRPRETLRVPLGGSTHDVEDLAVARLRRQVWVSSRAGHVRGFDLQSGALVATWHLGSPATAVAISPDERWVAMGTSDGLVCLRRYRDGALVQCTLAHDGQISDLAFSVRGERLSTSSWNGEVTDWQIPSLAVAARRRFAGAACALAWSADGRLAIARSAFPPVRSPEVVARERREPGGAPDEHHAVTIAHADGTVRHLRGHRGPVIDVAWAGGAQVLSASWDGTVRLWEVARARELASYRGFTFLVRSVAFAGERLVAVGAWTRGRDGRATTLLERRAHHRGRQGGASVRSQE